MIRTFITTLFSVVACAGEVRPIDGKALILVAEDIVPASNSPDGRFMVATLYLNETTATTIGIISSDKTKFLQPIPTITNNMTMEPYKKWLTLRWSSDSRYLAVHDGTAKHSVLSVFREKDGSFYRVTVPDLSAEISKDFPPSKGGLFSSGQLPIRWSSPSRLNVELRAVRTKGGKIIVRKISVEFPQDGEAAVVR